MLSIVKTKKNITIGIILLIIWTFLLFNTDLLFGRYASEASQTLNIYFLFVVGTLAMLGTGMPDIKLDLRNLTFFSIFFVATLSIVYLMPIKFAGSFEAVKSYAAFGILYAFVKAFPEELIFRWALPEKAGLGHGLSNILFGAFHASVLFMIGSSTGLVGNQLYMFALGGGLFLGVLGLMWSFIYKKYGLMASTGSHLGYNVAVMGMGAMILGGLI